MSALLRRLTGPALVSWPVLVLIVVWSTALNLLGGGQTVTGGALPRAAAAAIAGTLACAVMVGAWYALIRRIGHQGSLNGTRLAAVILSLLLAGLVRGAALQVILVSAGLAQDSTASALVRLVSSLVTIPAAFIVGAAAAGAILEFRRDAGALIIEQEQLGRLLNASAQGLEQRRIEAVERVQQQLDEEVSRLPADDATAAVLALETLAGDVVRPLSHELARDLPTWDVDEPSRVPLVPWGDVFRAPDPAQAIRPLALVALMAVIGIPGGFLVYSPARGLLTLGGTLAVLAGCLILGRRWLEARKADSPAAAWASIAIVLVATAVACSAVAAVLGYGDRGQGAYARLALVAVPIFGLLVAIVSMLTARMRAITVELAETNRDLRWSLARINAEAWEQGGRLSRALHGPVQSLLHARMLGLRRSLEAEDSSAPDIISLRSELQASLAAALGPASTTLVLEDVLRDVTQTWSGVAEVRWRIDAAASALLADDTLCAEAIADLVTEAVSNAVRHGRASTVDISIDISELDLVRLQVVDDGIATETSAPGLGTVVLARCTFDWSLSREAPTTLTARLPVQVRERTFEPQ